MPTDRAAPGPLPPRWLELGAATAAVGLASVGVAGLTLAVAGAFSAAASLALGLPVAVLAALVLWRASGPAPETPRSVTLAASVAVAIAAAFLVGAAWAPSTHVLINRDPGSYTTTARWLDRTGGLEAVAATGGLPADGSIGLGGYAVHDLGDGNLQFQFNHLTSVALAVAHGVGGHWLMFRLPALVAAVGLLVLYAVAVRVTRRPWAALVAPALLGATMPFLHVARDTYSEPFAMLLLWGAVLVGVVAVRSGSVGAAGVAGLLLGATTATRIDSLLFVALALWLLTAHVLAAAGAARRFAGRCRVAGVAAAATLLASVPGALDLQFRSGRYAVHHAEELAMLRWLVAASAVGGVLAVVVTFVRPGLVARSRGVAARVSTPAALVVAAVLLAGWWIRPHVQVARSDREVPLIGSLQAAAGVAVDASRQYAEMSLEWASWYLGPVALAAGITGVALCTRRVLQGRADVAAAPVTALVVVAGGLYWWRPSIVPDQVWAMRRYVPAVLPALSVAAAVGVSAVVGCVRLPSGVRKPLAGVLALSMVMWAGAVTWPVRQLREQHGYVGAVLEACEVIGTDATVVVVGAPSSDVLPQPLRSWCGVPVGALAEVPAPEALAELRARVRTAGRTLTWVSADPTRVRAVGGPGVPSTTRIVGEQRQARRTLLEPPSAYSDPGAGWSLTVRREGPPGAGGG